MAPDELSAQLARVEGKLDRAILHFENTSRIVDGFDAKIGKVQEAADGLQAAGKHLADAALQMRSSNSRLTTIAIVAALIGSLIGVTATNAFARHSDATHQEAPR